MATKWKGRTFGFIIALLLFTFGLTSIGLLLDRGHEYLFKTYFDTDQFAAEMESFIHELGKYEIYHGEDVEDDWIKEKELSELYDLKKVFKFYLRDINTNEVYTNLYSSNESFIDSEFTKPDMKHIQEYSRLDGTELVVNNFQNEIDGDPKLLEGRIGVLVSAPEDISVIANYQTIPATTNGLLLLYNGWNGHIIFWALSNEKIKSISFPYKASKILSKSTD